MENYNNYNQFNNQDPTNRDPYSAPSPADPGKSLAMTASFIGVASIAMSFFMPIGIPLILAVISIVLSILSQGKNTTVPEYSKRSLRLGIIGLVLHLSVLGAISYTSYKMITDQSMRSTANQVMQQMYGYSLDDVLRTLDEEYGTSLLHANGSSDPTIM